jgi:isopenicillin-N epimerase
VRAACHRLAAEACQRIAALTGLPQIAPDSPEWFAQMCVAPLPIADDVAMEEAKRRLWDEYQVEVPLVSWNSRRFVRVSIQAYNSHRDVDRWVEGLAALL